MDSILFSFIVILEFVLNILKGLEETRNPIIDVNGITIRTIGDPHIGKSFKQGVPKDLLGKREQMSLDLFRELLNSGTNYVIIVGDLFDKFQVDVTTFYKVLMIVEEASKNNPNTKFIFLNGNHDLSKEAEKISSFQLLQNYIEKHQDISNIRIILSKQEEPILKLSTEGIALGLFHYNPFMSIDEEYTDDELQIDSNSYPIKIAFGHWETIDFNSDVFINRQVPTKVLKYFDYVVTGHEHRPKITLISNVPVLTVGSMLPYAFSEQLDVEEHVNYYTLNIEDINTLLNHDINYFENTCVRILVSKDNIEEIPDFKCLSKTFKNMKEKEHKVDNESEDASINESVTSFSSSLYSFIEESEELFKDNVSFISELIEAFSTKNYKEVK